jgi:DNA-binding NarL/FixJ family response regulator
MNATIHRESTAPADEGPARGIGSRVLIVEDSAPVRSALLGVLGTTYPGCHFLVAASGEEALELAEASAPAIVLMDLRLPGMNGIEATRRLVARHPAARVVVVTLFDLARYREEALKAGAVAYVLKGDMRRELLPLVGRLLHECTLRGPHRDPPIEP